MSVVITASSSFSPVTWKQSLGGVKKGVLRNFAGKPLCQCLFFKKVTDLRPATLLKETLAQVFSCEFCEISKNAFIQNTTGRLLLETAWKVSQCVKIWTRKTPNMATFHAMWVSLTSFCAKLLRRVSTPWMFT